MICAKYRGKKYRSSKVLTGKEIYTNVKKATITETIRLYRLCWFGDGQRVEGNRIPKRVLYMDLEMTRL
jgi:hypothetical protein